MATSKTATLIAIAALSGFPGPGHPSTGGTSTAGSQGNSAFLGPWCAQGDRIKHCSVGGNGVFLIFTNVRQRKTHPQLRNESGQSRDWLG